MSRFRLKVEDVFLIGKKTILSGILITQESSIDETKAQILVDGIPAGSIVIGGEVMCTGHNRDLWSQDLFPISKELFQTSEVWIVAGESEAG